MLALLAESSLAGEEEVRILQVASNDSLAQKVTALEDVGARQPSTRVSGIPEAERVMVEAARLRVVTDRKIGQQTPQWIVDLARTPD